MNVKIEQIDLEAIDDTGARCACCHRPIAAGAGITFGRPSFRFPAPNVCRRCVEIALTVLGVETLTLREGRC